MGNALHEVEVRRLEAVFAETSEQWARLLTDLERLHASGQNTANAQRALNLKRLEYDHVLSQLSQARKLLET